MNWLPVKNYEGIYEVSDTGEVRSVDRELIEQNTGKTRKVTGKNLSLLPNQKVQYMQVSLWKLNKAQWYYVHRLVAEAFIPNPNNLPEVNHIDGNRQNNNVTNLEWVTRECSIQHAIQTGLRVYKSRLTEEDFLECLNAVLAGESYNSLSQRVPYQVPFLSTKLRALAKKYGLEEQLDKALKLQREQQQIQAKQTQKRNRGKRIQMLDPTTDVALKEFDCVGDAERYIVQFTKTSSGSISNAALGRQKTAGGYKWKYI